MKKDKHYFASANSGVGFYNLFNEINEKNKKDFQYILKGGAGTGKSTLMKKVGKHFSLSGYDIEYFHCSSDYKSLDGVRIKELNVSVVDGTAPHVCEASMPGVKEKIINLGEYIGESVKAHEKEIKKLAVGKKHDFDSVYLYISAAKKLYDVNTELYQSLQGKFNAGKEAKKIVKNLCTYPSVKQNNFAKENSADAKNCGCMTKKEKNKNAQERKLFKKAVAGGGIIDFLKDNQYTKKIELENNSYNNSLILNSISEILKKYGYDFISFFEPLSPENREAIYICDYDLIIFNQENTQIISNKTIRIMIEKNIKLINELLKLACNFLKSAKIKHKKIEAFYIASMNFNGLNFTTEKLIREIEEMSVVK